MTQQQPKRAFGGAGVWLVGVALAVSLPGWASAQEWLSGNRTTPALWEIIGIDASGERNWPYYQEDIAGDGLNQYGTLEERMDARSVYVNRDPDNRLWLRFYVASDTQPPSSAQVFLFIDTDRDSFTGHVANGGIDNEWRFFSSDPTTGGYERVIGVQGDGTVLGVWRWDNQNLLWVKEPDRNGAIVAEVGEDNDRLRVGPDPRGYIQLNADASATGINANCDARFFLRTWNVDANDPNDPALNFGDTDVGGALACVPPDQNQDGTPDIIYQTVTGCTADGDCPGNSYCYIQNNNGVCVIGYECTGDADCRANETCTNNFCVQVVQTNNCSSSADCGAFVCDNNQCTTCTQTGARACPTGFVCVPDGRCIADSTVGVITCTADADCGALVCENNQCTTCTQTGPRACPAGYACAADGHCTTAPTGNTCAADAECGALVCDNNQCTTCTQTGARACPTGYACAGDGTCTQTPAGQNCTQNADCGALVCDNNQCVACNQGGAPACDGGVACAANGLCGGGTAGDTSGGSVAESDFILEPGERVQGGSCTCDATRTPTRDASSAAGLIGLLCAAALWLRARSQQRSQQGETR